MERGRSGERVPGSDFVFGFSSPSRNQEQSLTPWPTDLAGIRDAAALANLPADEQKAFTQLWADVVALLKKAGP